jgi:hypothetical protein
LGISWLHQKLLTLESISTKRNILLFLITFAFLSWAVVPYTVYALETIDIHYLGWFNHPLPPLALTTPHKNYYERNNLPFRTIDTVKANHTRAKIHAQSGLP